ncbi:hypothetical protein N9W89_05905 [Hellea sp.]|nr:hypothetical protein [Hellea sp.]
MNEPFKVITQPSGAVVISTMETPASKKARLTDPSLQPEYYGCAPTPCEFIVPRRSKFVARVEKEGYEPAQIVVRSSASLSGKATGLSAPATTATAAGIATATSSSGLLGLGTALTAFNATGVGLMTAPVVAIDAVSGGMLSLNPNPVALTLKPDSDSQVISYDLDTLSDGDDTWNSGVNSKQHKEKQAQKKSKPASK